MGKNILIADRTNNRAVVLPATGNAGDLKGPCGANINANGQDVTKDNFIQLSNEHLECLNAGQTVLMTYNAREVKQVDPDDYGEGCLEGIL